MIIDSSAWIEFLRDAGSDTCDKVADLITAKPVTCEAIVMEILAGAQKNEQLTKLRSRMARCTLLKTEFDDYEMATVLYRNCRHNGQTPRSMLNRLIAAVAIRHQTVILHLDKDHEVIAQYSDLISA